jgi:hypothetical protein
MRMLGQLASGAIAPEAFIQDRIEREAPQGGKAPRGAGVQPQCEPNRSTRSLRPVRAQSLVFVLKLLGYTLDRQYILRRWDLKEPGLDGRHRDQDGHIQQKRSDTMNKNISKPIEGFGPNTTLKTMR